MLFLFFSRFLMVFGARALRDAHMVTFYRLQFGLKMESKCFFILGVFGQKTGQKFFQKFFLTRSSYFSKLMKDTETVLFREGQH